MRGETQRVAERVRLLLDPDRLADDAPPPAPDDERDAPAEVIGAAAGDGDADGDRADERDGATGAGPARRAAHRPVGWRQRLAARVPVRVDPGHRAAAAVGVVVIVVAIVAGVWLWSSGPRAVDIVGAATPIAGAGTPAGTAAPSVAASSPVPATSSAATEVVVDVAGRVVRPGVYHLPAGARVADAIVAAGGARRGVDLTPINLAAVLADGQQIAVGVTGAGNSGVAAGSGGAVPASGTGTAGGAPSAGAGALVDLNTATLEQLETLPGIGPALGQRILDYRSAQGPFRSVGQLNDVSGIGDVKFGQLEPLVTV